MTISDDGVGMPVITMGMGQGIGLPGMRHRVESLGGRFRVRKLKLGTRISAIVPTSPRISHA